MTSPYVFLFKRFLRSNGLYDLFLEEFERIGRHGKGRSLSRYLDSLEPRYYIMMAFNWNKSSRPAAFWCNIHLFWLHWLDHLDHLFSSDL